MAVSPADFELYSRVTGRQVPRDRGERMKMAPEVNKFIKNRGYEHQDKTTLQKGADILGKTALGVGTLAGLYALGGGFKGAAAAEVAKAVENVAKTKPTGIEPPQIPPGGGPKPTPPPVTGPEPTPPPSGGDSPQITLADEGNALAEKILNRPGRDLDSLDVNIGENIVQVSPTRDKADDFVAKVKEQGPLNAFEVPYKEWDPITKTVKGEQVIVRPGWSEEQKQAQAEKIYGEKLTQEQRASLHGQWDNLQREQRQYDYPGEGSTQAEVDSYLNDKYRLWSEEVLRGIPGVSDNAVYLSELHRERPYGPIEKGNLTSLSRAEKVAGRPFMGKPINEKTKQLQSPFPPDLPPALNMRSDDGGALVATSPKPTSIVAVDPESNAITSNKVGIIQKAEKLGDDIEEHVRRWWHLDNEKMGMEIQGALENQSPLAGGAQIAKVILGAAAKQGLINTGQTAETLYGYGKSAYEKAQDFILDYQIKRASMGIGDGKLDIGPSFSVQTALDRGWDRHDKAVEPIVQKVQSMLPTTRSTGQVAIGENAQLTRTPRLQPSDSTLQVPSRAIQQFSDKRISGEGSLTPGDRSDLQALLSGSRGQYGPIEGLKALGPDETVSGDIEIRTDIDVDDPVLFKSLYGRRVGRGEKQKFIAGLKERNPEVYSGEGFSGMRRGSASLVNPVTGEVKGSSPDYETHFGSDSHVYREDVANALRQKYKDGSILRSYKKGQETRLPQRKEGTGIDFATGKRGTGGGSIGQAITVGGTDADKTRGILYTSPDERSEITGNVFKDVPRQFKDAFEEGDQAGWDVGKRMAEKEIQGKLFKDDDDPWL